MLHGPEGKVGGGGRARVVALGRDSGGGGERRVLDDSGGVHVGESPFLTHAIRRAISSLTRLSGASLRAPRRACGPAGQVYLSKYASQDV